MQDLQNYQYYDPSPQPTPVPWWQRKRTWQLAGLLAIAGVVLVFAAIAAVNVLKNRQLVSDEQDLLNQAEAIESQLGAECEEGDSACFERARADAARALGISDACDGLEGEAFSTCVTLIAQDKQDPEVCKALEGDDKTSCLDTAYLLKAKADLDIELCEQISSGSTMGVCNLYIRDVLVAQGKCAEAGVDVSECEGNATLKAAIQTGDVKVCEALAGEMLRYECGQAITSIDKDDDGLVLSSEFELGLSDSIPDSDADGLSDGDEVHVHATDPVQADTDGDGFSDGTEVDGGYDPLS